MRVVCALASTLYLFVLVYACVGVCACFGVSFPGSASPLEHLLSAGRDLALWDTRARVWGSAVRLSDRRLQEPQDEFEHAPLPKISINRQL
jgi:hypothetical protein